MVPIARACSAAGHEVAVAAPASFAEHVQGAGLPHLPFPDVPSAQMRAVFDRLPTVPREEANRIVLAEVFGRLDAQAALPTLVQIVKDWRPDAVLREPCEFASLVAAERAGVVQVQVAISMGEIASSVLEWLDEPLRELAVIGAVHPDRVVERALATPTFTSVPALLDGSWDGANAVRERHPVWRYRTRTDSAGPPVPSTWGDPATPLVYVTFGSVAGSRPEFNRLYSPILDVLAALPVRVLMTTGAGFDPADLNPLPDNARVMQWWPQEAAMSETALVVGHGGFGTTMTALSAGVPQLVMPLFAFDQFLNAQRVEAVGAGLQLLGGLDALGQVPAAIQELLAQARFPQAAAAVAAEIAALPDVVTTVDILQDVARGGIGPPTGAGWSRSP
jgi:UDP:flavonoid glycosyltransferase YjiC (YdhE family)